MCDTGIFPVVCQGVAPASHDPPGLGYGGARSTHARTAPPVAVVTPPPVGRSVACERV